MSLIINYINNVLTSLDIPAIQFIDSKKEMHSKKQISKAQKVKE